MSYDEENEQRLCLDHEQIIVASSLLREITSRGPGAQKAFQSRPTTQYAHNHRVEDRELLSSTRPPFDRIGGER
jgi:hypothetical protein